MSDTNLLPEIDQNDNNTAEDEDDSSRPPPSLHSGHLNWRMPPEESFSDWTIEIITTKPAEALLEQKDVYHVHKNVLAVGPKKCVYFERLFQNKQFSECEARTSKIELNTSAAAAFPCMLDYMYSPEHKLEIDTKNATALYFLGQYFENLCLRWQAAQFRQEDLSTANCGIYFAQAQLFKEEKLLERIAKFCFENLECITPDSDLIELSDMELWSKLFEWTRGDAGSSRWFYKSKHLSCLFGKYISLHKDDLDATTFTRFTAPACMVEIDKSAAVTLLQVEALLFPESKTSDDLSTLQTRCVEALARAWESIDVPKLEHDLSGLNPILFRCAFAKALATAKLHLWLENAKFEVENQVLPRKQDLPSRILVSGAGSEEVNGIYTVLMDSWYNDALMFHKRAHDGNGGFEISLIDDLDDNVFWSIERYPTTLYRKPIPTQDNQLLPPRQGWLWVHGLLPAPTLTYLRDGDADQDA
jgi:hypothetical protein